MASGLSPERPGFSLPVGTVTFLLTDVEGSTQRWEHAPTPMGVAIARHYELLDAAIVANQGVRPVEQGEGDSVVGAFARASDAIAAALDAQRQLAAEVWPDGAALAVRMAIHTGEAELRDEGNYFGPAVIRCARLRAIARGGQVLVSGPTAEVVGDRLPEGASLTDLGLHRLKDLGRPEHVWELRHPELAGGFGPLRSLDNLPNNLPVQLTTFVGRRAELDELRDLVATTRLLSLNGVGGCGKTRLALQLAAEVLESYPGGAWLAELAPVVDPDRVLATVASALGERDLAGDLIEAIVNRLGERATLVVLDNCEHLLGPIATLVDTLLRRCPNLTVVATSREPIGVPGETGWRVPSLSAPTPTDSVPIETVSQFDAVRLFVDRATKARPNFRLTNDNAPAVAQICHRLDGIPLAIELAAARVRGLTVEQVAAGLDDRFRLLTGGARTVLPRQQTLQASVDWGYELLSDAERAVFRRLTVFAGGFTLDAAEPVVASDGIERVEVLDLLLGLVDKSMVVADDDTDRYRMLETLRQYGTARLVDAGETAIVRDRHLAWAITLFDVVEARSVGDRGFLVQVGTDVDNLRAAYEWALLAADADAALLLGATLMGWESDRGDATEASVLGSRALALADGQLRLRLMVMAELLHAQFEAADFAACRSTRDELLEHVGDLDPDDVMVRVFCLRMTFFARDQNVASHVQEALELAETAGLHDAAEVCASMLAVREAWRGNWRDAQEYAARIGGDPLASVAAGNAWWARIVSAECRGDFDAARAHLGSLGFEQHPQPRLAAQSLATLVHIDLAQGRDSGAAARVIPILDEARRRRFVAGVALAGWAPGAWALGHGDIDTAVRELVAWRATAESLPFSDAHSLVVVQALLAADRIGDARSTLETLRTSLRGNNPLYQARLATMDGLVCRAEGNPTDAEGLHHDALTALHAGGWRPDLAHSLEALADIAAAQESYVECARLSGAAQALRDEMGYVLRWPYEQRLRDADFAAARGALSDDAFDAAFAEGLALNEAAAVAYAQRARGERKRPTTGWQSLTPTETDIVRLVAEGLTNKQIGERLLMGAETVKTHLSHVYDKLGVRNRAALAAELGARPG